MEYQTQTAISLSKIEAKEEVENEDKTTALVTAPFKYVTQSEL
jgi:hypothetical protein